MFKRVSLYLITNLAVLVILGVLLLVLERLGLLGDYGAAGYVPLLIISVLWGFGGSLISLFLSKFIAKRSTGAHVITQPRNQDEAWLLATVQSQAQRAGIGMPEVAVYGSHQPNAFATGASRNSALVAVSTGLLGSMSRDEVEAVLAHEVSHVANGDMVTLALVQGVLNTFVIFASRVIGQIVDRAVFRRRRGYGPGYWLTVILMQVVLGLFATIVVMWFSRVREYRADEGGARLAGPQKMVSALRRLQQAHEPADLPESMEAMGIRSGPKRGLRALFASHPPLEERIAKLVADSQAGAFG